VITTDVGDYRLEPWGDLVDPYGNAAPLRDLVDDRLGALPGVTSTTVQLSQTATTGLSATSTTLASVPTTLETSP
jgi:hypothetical protein